MPLDIGWTKQCNGSAVYCRMDTCPAEWPLLPLLPSLSPLASCFVLPVLWESGSRGSTLCAPLSPPRLQHAAPLCVPLCAPVLPPHCMQRGRRRAPWVLRWYPRARGKRRGAAGPPCTISSMSWTPRGEESASCPQVHRCAAPRWAAQCGAGLAVPTLNWPPGCCKAARPGLRFGWPGRPGAVACRCLIPSALPAPAHPTPHMQ